MNKIEAQAIRAEAESLQLYVSQGESWINHRDKADEQTFRLGIWMTADQGIVPSTYSDNKRIIATVESKEDWEALKIFARHFIQMEGIQHIEEDYKEGKIRDAGHGHIPVKDVG